MFDYELTSVIAIFAGIAALIAYIRERTKQRIKTNGQPFKLKKMSGAQETSDEQSSLDNWHFPQPTETHVKAHPRSHSKVNNRVQDNIKNHAIGRTPHKRPSANARFGTRAKLREAIVTMTVLGPCRSLAPYQEREHN